MMAKLCMEDYLRLRENAQLIESDEHGDKVLQLPDESYLKLFRQKRLLSSALIYPYASRFADNIAHLTRIGIPCPRVIGVYRIAAIKRDAVHYRPLYGKTVRQIVRDGIDEAQAAVIRKMLGIFVAELHAQGIYFRSLHLGNIILTEPGNFGLIDVADMQIRRGPLTRSRRLRNILHLSRYSDEAQWLMTGDTFADSYSTVSGFRIQ